MESYLAGAGASGSLLAGAFIMFVLLVGAATFDSWPHSEGLLPFGSDVTVETGAGDAQAPAAAAPDLIKLLGHRRGPAHGQRAHAPTGAQSGRHAGGELGGDEGIGGGSAPDSPGQNTIQPSGPSGSGSGSSSDNVVQKTVSDLGNAVESNTSALGKQVGASTSPEAGDLVSGLGSTVNSTLQKLTGSR